MTDTNIPALLEELREVEPLLWEKITYLDQGDRVIKFAYQVLDDFALDHLQGCIQRACEHQKWIWHHGHGPEMGYVATVNHGNIIKGETSAAAILAAYIEAVRARQ